METTPKRPKGRPLIDKHGEQRQIIQFPCSDGTKEVWKVYADNLQMNPTDLFYKMIDIVSGQMGFITWLEGMARDCEGKPEYKYIVDSYNKNREFIESWKCVCRLCDNTLMLNKGRLKKAQKSIPEKLAKEVSEALHRHFEKKS